MAYEGAIAWVGTQWVREGTTLVLHAEAGHLVPGMCVEIHDLEIEFSGVVRVVEGERATITLVVLA